jgi:hypothetical protein
MNRGKKVKLPPKILEDRGRGTLIRNLTSQGKLLQYWARTEANIEVGIFLPEESNGVPRNIEYWMNLTLQWVPNARPEQYPGILRDMCIQRTRMISNGMAQWLSGIEEFRVETRYAFNTGRVWFCPLAAYGIRVKWPMAEDPAPKDRWYAGSGIMAYTFPLTEEVHEEPSILFGPGSVLQERYDDEEIQGGKIALVAVKQMRAQKPPNGLDRMQSTFSKQVGYNRRIMEAEIAIAGINCDIPHFLEDMTLEEPVYVCINSSEEMARGEQAIAGQLWIQGDRQMTASSTVPEGMADTTDSALLAAVAEAVAWNHASQEDEGRKGQRVIIYPKDLTQLEEFLGTYDPNVDPEDGHPIAYEVILRESSKYEATPQFWREDSTRIVSDCFRSEHEAGGTHRMLHGRNGPEGRTQSSDSGRSSIPKSSRESHGGTPKG